jgi:hypothetical protein
MRTRELVAAIALAAFATACVSNPDPRKPTVTKMQTQGIGAWVVATSIAGWEVQGELISVTREYVHILRVGQPGAALVYLRTADVARANVYTYEYEGGLGAMGLLGTLSTISHGFILIFTAPIWIIATAIAVASESSHVELEYPEDHTLEEISRWARFPQGIPPSVDEEALLMPRASRRRPPAIIAPPSVTPPPLTPPSETPSQPPPTNPAMIFQQAKAAAARNDCALVLELSGAVQLADQPYWDNVFSKDAQIRACLNLKP